MARNKENSALLLSHFLELPDDLHERSPLLDEAAQGYAFLCDPIHGVTSSS
jgi:hypothetical protein